MTPAKAASLRDAGPIWGSPAPGLLCDVGVRAPCLIVDRAWGQSGRRGQGGLISITTTTTTSHVHANGVEKVRLIERMKALAVLGHVCLKLQSFAKTSHHTAASTQRSRSSSNQCSAHPPNRSQHWHVVKVFGAFWKISQVYMEASLASERGQK